jgi:hypothetical protein
MIEMLPELATGEWNPPQGSKMMKTRIAASVSIAHTSSRPSRWVASVPVPLTGAVSFLRVIQ